MTPTARQEDALRELAHLGSAQAATLLARLVGDVGVLVDVPQVMQANRFQLAWLLGGRDVEVVAATFGLEGPVKGQLWWVMRVEDARRLGQRLLQRPGVHGPLSADARAALTEASNLVASACADALGTMIGAGLLPTTPEVRELSVSSLVGPAEQGPDFTVLSAPFVSTNAPLFSGWLVVLLDEANAEDVVRRLGV